MGGKRVTEEEKKKIWKLRDRGMSLRDISKETRRSVKTVQKVVNERPPSEKEIISGMLDYCSKLGELHVKKVQEKMMVFESDDYDYDNNYSTHSTLLRNVENNLRSNSSSGSMIKKVGETIAMIRVINMLFTDKDMDDLNKSKNKDYFKLLFMDELTKLDPLNAIIYDRLLSSDNPSIRDLAHISLLKQIQFQQDVKMYMIFKLFDLN